MTHGGGPNSYDAVAKTYAAVRPRYPAKVFGAIESYARFAANRPRVLEIGSGTGQATWQMVARGWRVDCIEPGHQLSVLAQAGSEPTAVRVQNARFEDAVVERYSFDLVVAATSWHWVEPDIGHRKARAALRQGGVIALFWNAHVPDTTHPDWVPIRRAYLDVAPELADLAPLTPDRDDYDPCSELGRNGFFNEIVQRAYPFEVSYSADEFLELLGTYASHGALDAARRRRLHDRLRSAIEDELGGRVTKPYEALLVLGRRLP